jgi:hypothetical protein
LIRWIKTIVGIVLVLLGVLWSLQGLNVLPGSVMSGQSMWLVIGVVVALVGVWLLFSLRRGGARIEG